MVMRLPLLQRWCVTYAYAYPGLPKFVVLRCLKKYTGERVNWKVFLDQVDMGRIRIWAQIR